MAPKRSLELAVEDDVHTLTNDDKEPPIKLRNLSLPHTPLPKSSYSSSTTRTPFPSRPFDSPSNPFGRKRIRALTHTLPPPTSFSQHLPLRFQLVRPGISPRLGGVYRVVQVPLSYTFVHLRCLIAFLYGGGCVVDNEDRHLFEVVKRAAVYNQSYKPCQIKSGVTVVKLSSVRDPCRYRPEGDEDALGDGDGDANVGEGDESEAERTDDCEEGKGWIWAEEEDFTLAHAWPRGGDISRGIIYVRHLSLAYPHQTNYSCTSASHTHYSDTHNNQHRTHSETQGYIQYSLRFLCPWTRPASATRPSSTSSACILGSDTQTQVSAYPTPPDAGQQRCKQG
ncbi:hypothetical protein L208DRAFT_1411828 [Tricholoma matsutake]|nr:hypothetical protein L208DRAFT_1411828 [Tricholoma matsutake 945]